MRRLLVHVVVAVVSLQACQRDVTLKGSEQLAAPAPTVRPKRVSPTKPCALLTAAEIQDALGAQTNGQPSIGLPVIPGMKVCRYQNTRVEVTVGTLSAPNARRSFDRYLRGHKGLGLARVEQLGDSAVWDPGVYTLVLREGDTILGVTVFLTFPGVDQRAIAVGLAGKAVKRLGAP